MLVAVRAGWIASRRVFARAACDPSGPHCHHRAKRGATNEQPVEESSGFFVLFVSFVCFVTESSAVLSNWLSAPNSTRSSCRRLVVPSCKAKATPEGGVRANRAEETISVLEGVQDLTGRAGQR